MQPTFRPQRIKKNIVITLNAKKSPIRYLRERPIYTDANLVKRVFNHYPYFQGTQKLKLLGLQRFLHWMHKLHLRTATFVPKLLQQHILQVNMGYGHVCSDFVICRIINSRSTSKRLRCIILTTHLCYDVVAIRFLPTFWYVGLINQ